ncbi:MAG: hypothetical protein ACXU8N_06925 [Telluria sp.]
MIECNRTMEQARRDYAAGLLKRFVFLRVPMSARDWQVRLEGRRGDAGMLLDVATLAPQTFRSLDQAVEAVEQVGFGVEQLCHLNNT